MLGRWLILGLLLAAAGPLASARAQEIDEALANKIKAAYVYNFVRFAQWPEDAFENDQSPIVVTAVSGEPVADLLEALVAHERVEGRRVEVRRVRYPQLDGDSESDQQRLREWFAGLRRSHVVYLGAGDAARTASILTALRGADVLTIGEVPGFAEAGGMLGLTPRAGRIVFDANPYALQQTRVSVSSKVLRLARIVEPPRR